MAQYYAIVSNVGIDWIGYAGSAAEAVDIHMDDVGADSLREQVVYSIPDPPVGWEEQGPTGWLLEWVEDQGYQTRVSERVRVGGHVYGWAAVAALMDSDIVEDMAASGIYADDHDLSEYLASYCERHIAKHGEDFTIN